MLNPRLAWMNDRLNQTFAATVGGAAVAMYFILVRGWSWLSADPSSVQFLEFVISASGRGSEASCGEASGWEFGRHQHRPQCS